MNPLTLVMLPGFAGGLILALVVLCCSGANTQRRRSSFRETCR